MSNSQQSSRKSRGGGMSQGSKSNIRIAPSEKFINVSSMADTEGCTEQGTGTNDLDVGDQQVTVSSLYSDIENDLAALDKAHRQKKEGDSQIVSNCVEVIRSKNMRNRLLVNALREEIAFLRGKLEGREELKTEMEQILQDSLKQGKSMGQPSYASVASATPKIIHSEELPTMVIKKKDINMTRNDFKSLVNSIPLSDIVLDEVVQLKNTGDYIVKSRCEENLERLKQRLQESPTIANKVEFRKGSPRVCRLTILGIPRETTEDTILNIIENKLNLDHNSLDSKILGKRIQRKDGSFNQALLVPLHIGRDLLKVGKLNIAFQVCPIKRYVIIIRCFKCQKYGHTERDCQAEQKCANCAGDHYTKDCTTPNVPKCAVCLPIYEYLEKNKPGEKRTDYHHRATSRNCREYIRRYDAAIKRLDSILINN